LPCIDTFIISRTLACAYSCTNIHPYQGPPWNYPGNKGAGWTTTDYPSTAVDWIKVSFRTNLNAASEIAATAAVLLEDGTLYFPNTEALSTNNGTAFYIVIEHRNHLPVMTPTAVNVNGNTLTYDFKAGNSYTGSGIGQKEISPGIWVMLAGNGDQFSDVAGYEVTGADKALWQNQNGYFNVYNPTDFNMDSDVNGTDRIIWGVNNGIFSDVPK